MSLSTVLEMKNVSVGRENQQVLSSIDLTIANAEMCYLIGKSGSGKSTFLKSLYGVLPILGGQAEMVGFDLKKLRRTDLPEYRRKIGMVFQQFHLFERWSVAQNLDYVLRATGWTDKNKRNSRIEEVLNEVQLTHKADQPAHKLSGGEQQKVVIARAVLNHPEIIIADEPTGNLDPESSEEIMQLLYKVATDNKSAILIATHDYLLMEKFPSRVYRCIDNTIKED